MKMASSNATKQIRQLTTGNHAALFQPGCACTSPNFRFTASSHRQLCIWHVSTSGLRFLTFRVCVWKLKCMFMLIWLFLSVVFPIIFPITRHIHPFSWFIWRFWEQTFLSQNMVRGVVSQCSAFVDIHYTVISLCWMLFWGNAPMYIKM